jgi:hypothetical protein
VHAGDPFRLDSHGIEFVREPPRLGRDAAFVSMNDSAADGGQERKSRGRALK